MSRLSAGKRPSTGRQSLAEPLRVRNVEDNRQSYGYPVGRPSLGNGGGARKKSLHSKSQLPVSSNFATSSKRHSSGYGRGFGRSDLVKDPRQISDKAYQHRAIKRLVEFLLENGFPSPVSTKLLQSPQSKDFFRIFEFLYGYFDRKYKIGKKPEEDIPAALKSIRYPYNISKSSLFTIGTPHTWPHLLAALTWMLDIIQMILSVNDPESMMFGADEDGVSLERIQFYYYSVTYTAFLNGSDDYDKEDEELDNLLATNLGCPVDLETLTSDNQRLSQELELLEQNPDKVSNLEANKEILQADDQTYVKYLAELEAHLKDQEQLVQAIEEEEMTLAAELKTSEEEYKAMQTTLENQTFSAADVERIRFTLAENHRHIEGMEKEIEGTDSDIWSLEMEISKKQEQVEGLCRLYNKEAQKLRLVPSNAEYAKGRDLEIRPSFSVGTTGYLEIKPILQELKAEFQSKATEQAESRINSYGVLEEMCEVLAQKQQDFSLKESKLKRIEEDLNCKKEMFQKEWTSLLKQTEDTQSELSQLGLVHNNSIEDLKLQLQQTKKHSEQQKIHWKSKEEEFCNFLTQYVTTVIEHKLAISDGIEKMNKEMKSCLQRLTANPYTPRYCQGAD